MPAFSEEENRKAKTTLNPKNIVKKMISSQLTWSAVSDALVSINLKLHRIEATRITDYRESR